ncbi:MAG: hypothetical protein ABIK27_04380 [Bacteroidota bacterium]
MGTEIQGDVDAAGGMKNTKYLDLSNRYVKLKRIWSPSKIRSEGKTPPP